MTTAGDEPLNGDALVDQCVDVRDQQDARLSPDRLGVGHVQDLEDPFSGAAFRGVAYRFRPGQLNIITGESGTGKSSIIGILRFLLVSDSPHVPLGPIQNTVAWYGLLAHVGETRFFIGRPAPAHGATTSRAMLSIGEAEMPPFETLDVNTNMSEIVDYLGGLIGIEENLHVPAEGQMRRALAANLRHALFYCFQGQGEVANPDILFHHQNRDFQKQAIRDTFPYFLGAQNADALRKREELTELRRDTRRQRLRLEGARAARDLGVGRAAGLLADARASGLLSTDTVPTDAGEAFELLSAVLAADAPPLSGDDVDGSEEAERLIARRADLRTNLREINDKIRGLDDFARVGTEYGAELNEHRVRLASIGLVSDTTDTEALCPVCQSPLSDPATHEAIAHSLGRVTRRIELAQRDQPRITNARAELVGGRNEVRAELADIDGALEDLARTDDIRAVAQRTWDQQSFVRGRIAQYLDTTILESDDTISSLERTVADLEDRAMRLTEELDPEALRSAVVSILNIVGRRMTDLAQTLPLEHSDHGVRIDPYRLTVVADTLQGPAYMDLGAIGSGMSWVGYHLTAYLALQNYFIEAKRPVPRFIVFDQPSQAFFPRDRKTGGDLTELSDTDRNNTLKLYKMMFDVVAELDGQLQIIAFDHADFNDPWFHGSIIETWHNGAALIPHDWYSIERNAERALSETDPNSPADDG
jgi:energy-coupling factor transporter ATP-binding protein EcfA2